MKLFGRRKAVTIAAAAPLAAGMSARNYGMDTKYPPTAPVRVSDMEGLIPSALNKIAEPAGLKQYYDAVQRADAPLRFFGARRDLLRYQHGIDPNIDCLRSVSKQHKIIMHMRKVDRMHDEQRSLVEKMMDVFGVRDFFKKRDEMYGGNAVEAGQSSRY